MVGADGDLEGDVALGLAQQALADHPALDLVALAAGEGAVVDAEGHGEGGGIDRLGGQRLGYLGRGDGVGDGGAG